MLYTLQVCFQGVAGGLKTEVMLEQKTTLLQISKAYEMIFKRRFERTHHGQIDLNKILGIVKGTHQASKWIPLGP